MASAWRPRNPALGEEGKGDEDEPRVAVAAGCSIRQVGEDDVDGRGDEHQPEMTRMVLPVEVQLGPGEHQREAEDGQEEQHEPRRGRGACSA